MTTLRKTKRPSIPFKTQMKLWTLSAGRCEFLSCNEILWRDSLTFSEGNYSNIAHIISWVPSGPRGDSVLSPKLARDISNLMLLCQNHAKMIDIKKNIRRYSVERLLSFKRLHEARIRTQTDIKESRKTTVIRLQSNIRGRRVEVPQSDIYSALIAENRYPADEKGVFLDLTAIDYSPDRSFWDTAVKQINAGLDRTIPRGNDELRHTHLSIFGLAPIPLLVYLGYKIGNTIPSDIYVKTRGRNWRLTEKSSKKPPVRFVARHPRQRAGSKEVVLSIAISGSNSVGDIKMAIGKPIPIYELRIAHPGLDVIKSAKDLEVFRREYRSIMDEIRERHGKKVKIHLVAAVPSCAAIVCGGEILHGVDPSLIVYEHGDRSSGLFRALKLN